MAGPTVTLAFAGDAGNLHKTITGVGDDTRALASDVEKSSADIRSSSSSIGDGFGRAGEGADGAETKIMGLRDTVDGASAVMAGPGEAGISAYLQGWADLASGVAGFVVPAIQKIISTSLSQVAATASAVAANVVAAATTIAGWVAQGVAATASAVVIAAAWLVSIAPIALVIAGIALVAYTIYRNWDTIKDAFKAGVEFAKDRFNDIIDFFKKVPGWIGDAFSKVADIITAPYRTAFDLIKKLWNDTIGGFEFKIPSWIPGVGGKGFTIPKMHAGGIIPGPAGTQVPMFAMAGEFVGARTSQGTSAGNTTYVITAIEPAMIVAAIQQYDRANGTSIAS